ncbi:MAG TPA: hypothetical protein VGG89_14300 [Candidatus Baltobacteraceae bacterium]
MALAIAACSSTAPAGGPIPPPQIGGDGAKHKLKATVRIVIPKRKRGRRVLLHGHYVSLSTKSIAMAVTASTGGSPENFNADLTAATNPDCLAYSGSTVCTLPLRLAAGDYTIIVATYDGLLAGGNAPNNPPTGKKLSAHQSVPFAITRGKTNQLSVTLDGIPTGVALVPASSTLTGNDASGFALARCSQPAQNVEVYGVDADDNYILGPGAPTPALASNDAGNLPVTATPGPSAPNQFTLTPPAYPTKNAVVQLTAGVTPKAGIGASSQSAKVNVTFGSTTCYSISEYSASSSSSSGSSPSAIASDGTNLWFTVGNSVTKMTTAGAVVGNYSAGTNPGSLAFDGTNMWVVDSISSGTVTKLSSTGTTLGTYGVGSYPNGIAFDGTNMWVPNSSGLSVTKLSPTGATLGTYTVGSGPGAIAFDGTNMWVANYSASPGSVSELSPTGAALGTFDVGSHPAAVAFDGTNMWVTNLFDNTITELSPAGSALNTFTIPTSASHPEFIALGADSAMWFTEANGNNIGRVTSDGTFTEIPVPTASSEPIGIAKGPDGNMWFTEKSGDKIGTVVVH